MSVISLQVPLSTETKEEESRAICLQASPLSVVLDSSARRVLIGFLQRQVLTGKLRSTRGGSDNRFKLNPFLSIDVRVWMDMHLRQNVQNLRTLCLLFAKKRNEAPTKYVCVSSLEIDVSLSKTEGFPFAVSRAERLGMKVLHACGRQSFGGGSCRVRPEQ